MATAAQTRANRSNAQKSTGPRTPEGKAVVAQNAVKHGLLARAAVLQGEDWEEFAEFRENLIDELGPEGTLEGMLAERIVSLSWRLQRAARLQNEAYESLYLREATCDYGRMKRAQMAEALPGGSETGTDDLVTGRVLVDDFGGAKVLDRMLLYERRIEHSLYRTMGELRRLHLRREAEPRTTGATPEWGSAGREKGVASGKWEVSSEESQTSNLPSLQTSGFTLGTSPEPPDGVTTNTVVASTEPSESPRSSSSISLDQEPAACGAPVSRGVESIGPEPEGDSAKQSRFGAGLIEANLCTCEGLGQEGRVVLPQEQSQNEDRSPGEAASYPAG